MTTTTEAALERLLREALTKCRDQFAFYAGEHLSAGKYEKAATNQHFANMAASAPASSAAPSIAEGEIPPGMVPWHGGDSAPEDWDRAKFALRRNGTHALGLDWRHHLPSHHRFKYDIIAYTPRAAPAPAQGDEVERVATAIANADLVPPDDPDEYWLHLARAALSAQPRVSREDALSIAGEVCIAVAELPDRTSPDDQTDHMLVTADELQHIVADAILALGGGKQ